MAAKPVCKYGSSCYRKNPEHFKQYSHPVRDEEDGGEESEQRGGERGKGRKEHPPKTSKDSSTVKTPAKHGGTITSYFEKKPSPVKRAKHETSPVHVGAESAEEEGHSPPTKRRKKEEEGAGLPTCTTSKDTGESGSSAVSAVDDEELAKESDDMRENVKRKFLVQMPEDFYQFWEFCISLNPSDPQAALEPSLGLVLTGPYDVLAGRLKGVPWEKCVLHHRHFYDPPEMVTVVEASGDDTEEFHVGYFRDVPSEASDFWLVSNSSQEDCVMRIEGRSLFGAISHLIKKKLQERSLSSPKKQLLTELLSKIEGEMSKLKLPSLSPSQLTKLRSKETLTNCFHRMGLVVPYDQQTELGYRPLPLTDRELKKLLDKIAGCSADKSKCDQAFEPLQEIITFVQFANDECDYGMGLELGLDLFSHGDVYFHNVIEHLLPLAYDLLQREEYGKIVQLHLKERRRTPLDFRQ